MYMALSQSNSSTARKILQADMQLSSRCDNWSSHILSAVNGLTQSYLFKERLLKCEPIDLGRFIVDLRKRPLGCWTSNSDMHPWERYSKRSNYHKWCPLPAKKAQSPYTIKRNMFLHLPCESIRGMACFRLRAHTLRTETVTWIHNTSPNCELCNANDVQDEQHVLFRCTHPRVVSLCRTQASLFPPAELPFNVIHSVSRFRLCVHTLCHETATWNHMSSTTCDRCEADDDILDEQHVIF